MQWSRCAVNFHHVRPTPTSQGLAIPKNERDPKITGLLNSLLVKLEATKAGALLAGDQADKAYLEDFALKVFHRADKVDRAGLPDKKTAVTYLASFYFFEVRMLTRPPCNCVCTDPRAIWRARSRRCREAALRSMAGCRHQQSAA